MLEEKLRTRGARHPETLRAAYDLALGLETRGDLPAAAESYASYGFWEDAARTYQELMRSEPGNNLHWWRLAILSLELGRGESYRQTCEDMLNRFGDTGGTLTGARVAWTCSLQPAAGLDLERARRLVDPPFGDLSRAALGVLYYRMGRFADAVEQLGEERFNASPQAFVAIVWCLRAMAYHKTGDREKAREWLERADHKFAGNRERALWSQQVLFRVIRQEAAQLTGVPAEPDG